VAHHVGLHLLRLATLCAIAGLSACTTPMRPTTLPATAQPPALSPAVQDAVRLDELPPVPVASIADPPIDHSGRKQIGKASYYAKHFDGRKMANGDHFRPTASVAASKTLPLGTTAKVTNLHTGKSATVTVEDRGPYVRGRVMDVTPKVAEKLGMTKHGTAQVVVKPITVPQPNGGVKLGAGAAETPPWNQGVQQ
jgi:rare lipoprotein A